jgi:catechol 2,3-dioxygenase-like lactoylglutathione lyase family enzyme
MAPRFNYSGWFVADVPATVAFYQKALGMRLRYLHPSGRYAELETEDTIVAFIGEGFVDDLRSLGGALQIRQGRGRYRSSPARACYGGWGR